MNSIWGVLGEVESIFFNHVTLVDLQLHIPKSSWEIQIVLNGI